MEKWKKRAIDLVTGMMLGGAEDPTVVPYYPQKTKICKRETLRLPRSSPEAHGVSSKRIYNMLCELEGERRANIHSLLVLKDGELISECSRKGYSSDLPHLAHSMSKTVTAMAVGLLVDDGKLDTGRPVSEFFPEFSYKDKRFARITVEHLLTMTSGVAFSELGSVSEREWTRAFLESEVRWEPGSAFSYNSMNSYILARIVCRITGKSLTDFLAERLFSPLGITSYFWELGPEGVEKGGWGLYMSALGWARLGQLYLDRGMHGQRRILSEKWIARSGMTLGIAPETNGGFNYGYHLWVGREDEELLFNGMLGQNVWICPKNAMVVVVTCGNNELFQKSPALEILRKYLGHKIEDPVERRDWRVLRQREQRFFESRLWAYPCRENRGILALIGIRPRRPFVELWEEILGDYAIPKNNVDVLPLFVRGMQNNLRGGLTSLSLKRRDEELWLCYTADGEETELPVGLYGYTESVVDFRGESYAVRAMGDALYGPLGELEFRIELIFPELPNTRMIKLTRTAEGEIAIELTELPNNKVIDGILERIPEKSGVLSFAISMLEKKYGEGFLAGAVAKAFSPTLTGVDMDREDHESRISELEEAAGEQSRIASLVLAFVDRFISVDDEPTDADGDTRGGLSGLLGGIIGLFRREKPVKPDEIAQGELAEPETSQIAAPDGISADGTLTETAMSRKNQPDAANAVPIAEMPAKEEVQTTPPEAVGAKAGQDQTAANATATADAATSEHPATLEQQITVTTPAELAERIRQLHATTPEEE